MVVALKIVASPNMPDSLNVHEPVFVNTVGHCAGLVIFGFLLILLVKDARAPFRLRTLLPAIAAFLALLWNAGSLLVLSGIITVPAAAFSFSALSLMPAVLFSISLGDRSKWLQLLGWSASLLAVALHVSEPLLHTADTHRPALILIAVSFILLTVASAVGTQSPERTRIVSRIGGTMALLIFATSFIHFGETRIDQVWSQELAFHHAGIPLALFVVLQEQRFLLLDVIVRLVASAGLAAAFISLLFIANQQWHLQSLATSSPLYAGLCVVAACAAVVLFSELRVVLQRWLTHYVFRRRSLDATVRTLVNQTAANEPELLSSLAGVIADHAGAAGHRIQTHPSTNAEELLFPALSPRGEVLLPIRSSRGDGQTILLDRRTGGRRYLSEDLRDLGHLSLIAAGRLERFRSEESERLAAQAELRALHAQINPHFLFNSLNALYGTIPREAAGARRTVLNLADMFRYFLRTDRPVIPLSEEVRIVRAYLEIEQLRLGNRLSCTIDVDPQAMQVLIPALSIQPLIENAVRHGVAPKAGPGAVSLTVQCVPSGIRVQITDTGTGFADKQSSDNNGVGLENVRQRLRLNYGPAAELHISSGVAGTAVTFDVPDRATQCAL